MENLKDKKEMIIQTIPEEPSLKDNVVDLSGWHKLLHDYKMGLIERKELETKRKVYAETRLQLLRDRTKEIVEAYRVQVSAAKEIIIQMIEQYVTSESIDILVNIGDMKQKAMRQAATNYYNLVSTIDPNWPDDLKTKTIERAASLLEETCSKIWDAAFNIDNAIEKNYPEKRGFLDRFKK